MCVALVEFGAITALAMVLLFAAASSGRQRIATTGVLWAAYVAYEVFL